MLDACGGQPAEWLITVNDRWPRGSGGTLANPTGLPHGGRMSTSAK